MPIATAIKLKQAEEKIRGILNQYGLTWREIIPDIDKEIWRGLEQDMKEIRSNIFRVKYPRLYAQTKRRA
ncbi:MAG: hypothetical protein AAB642_00860 [Patescibacteria group bacterium]